MQTYITIQGVNYPPHTEEERLVFLITKIAHLEAKLGRDKADLHQDRPMQKSQHHERVHILPPTSDASTNTDPVIVPAAVIPESELVSASKADISKSKTIVSMQDHKQLQKEYKKLLKASKAIFRVRKLVLKLAKKHEETQLKATEKRNRTRKAADPGFIDGIYKPTISENLSNLLSLVKKSKVRPGEASHVGKTDPDSKMEESAEDEQSDDISSSQEANDDNDEMNQNAINVDSEETGSLGKRMPAGLEAQIAIPIVQVPVFIERPLPVLSVASLASATLSGRRPSPPKIQTTISSNNAGCVDCQTRDPPKPLEFKQLSTFYFQHLKFLSSKPVCWCGK